MPVKTATIIFMFAYALCVFGDFNLTIVHISDFHSHWFEFDGNKHDCSKAESKAGKCYGGFPRLLSFVREIRKKEKNVLVLSSGEFFMGDSLYPLHGYKMAHALLPKLELDAMSLSNHDFDNGIFKLSVFLYSMKFPVLCANMIARNTSFLYSRVNKSVVLDVNGEKVGIVGYIHRHALKKTHNAVSFRFIPEIPVLQEEVSQLENEGINKIIALGHAGYFTDLEIAKTVKGVDIVMGGDSDIMLFDPGHNADELSKVGNIHGNYPRVHHQEPELADDPSLVNRTLVLHIPQHGMYVGVLRATFDDNGKIIHESGEPVLLDSSIPQDEATLEFMEWAKGALEELRGHSRLPHEAEILGVAKGHLDGNPRSCRMYECSLGNFIADAMLHEFTFHYRNESERRYLHEQWGPIDALVFNSGAILRSIESGFINIKDIVKSIYLGDFIKRTYMSGQQVVDLMEHSVKHYDSTGVTAPGSFLQISGMKVEYDMSKPPGKRVKSLEIRCRDCGDDDLYYPIVPYKTYIIGMPYFMHRGRDGFYRFELPYDPNKDMGQLDAILLVEHLRRIYEVIPKLDGRIKFYRNNSLLNSSFAPPLIYGEPASEYNKLDDILGVSENGEISEMDIKEGNDSDTTNEIADMENLKEYETKTFSSGEKYDSLMQEPKTIKNGSEKIDEMSKSSDNASTVFLKDSIQSSETNRISPLLVTNNETRNHSNSEVFDLMEILHNRSSEIFKSSYGNMSKKFLDSLSSSDFLEKISRTLTRRSVEDWLEDNGKMKNSLEFKNNISSFMESLDIFLKNNLPITNLSAVSNETQKSALEDIVKGTFEKLLRHILRDDVLTGLFKNQTGINDTTNTAAPNVTDFEEVLRHILRDDVLTGLFKNQTGINDTTNTTAPNVTDVQ